MKFKAKLHFAAALCAALTLVFLLFAVACGDGNGNGAKLKLDVDADCGTIGVTEYTLSAGDSVYGFLKDKKPDAAADFEFAGWYEGGAPLAEDRTMPAEGLTLTAKFYTAYSLTVYSDDGAGNYPAAPETVTGKGLYGEAFAYVPGEHFTLDPAKQNDCTRPSLGKGEAFTVWLLREAYTVTYLAEAPTGVLADVPAPGRVAYGLEYKVEAAALLAGSAKNYRFRGWSPDRNGDVRYAEGDVLPMPSADVTLYAV